MHSTMEQIAIKNSYARPGFACSMELWNFPWSASLTRSGGRRNRSNSLKISVVSLKFGEIMQSNMSQIAIYSGHARLIAPGFVEIWNFPG